MLLREKDFEKKIKNKKLEELLKKDISENTSRATLADIQRDLQEYLRDTLNITSKGDVQLYLSTIRIKKKKKNVQKRIISVYQPSLVRPP